MKAAEEPHWIVIRQLARVLDLARRRRARRSTRAAIQGAIDRAFVDLYAARAARARRHSPKGKAP